MEVPKTPAVYNNTNNNNNNNNNTVLADCSLVCARSAAFLD